MRVFERTISTLHKASSFTSSPSPLSFGPFNASTQIRWKKKPVSTAQTRLENRTRDPNLDKLTARHRRLTLILSLQRLLSARKRGPYIPVQFFSKWARHTGLTTLTAGDLLRKYPHIFEVFTHPIKRSRCCKFTLKFIDLMKRESSLISQCESANVMKLKKILMMSVNGTLHMHALRLVKWELGLPANFPNSIIRKYEDVFKLVDLEFVELINRGDEGSEVAEIEKWREKEYREKWLSETEVKYAFPINFPTGFKIESGYREKLRNWQMLSYVKPYERMEVVQVRSRAGIERYEKRAVAIIHELLCLTVEKMLPVERLVHFRKDLGFEVNIRELLLKHPGIFYVSTKGNTQIVYLREAYNRAALIEPNLIYDMRRKLLNLIVMGSRNTRPSKVQTIVEEKNSAQTLGMRKAARQKRTSTKSDIGINQRHDDFILPILERSEHNTSK